MPKTERELRELEFKERELREREKEREAQIEKQRLDHELEMKKLELREKLGCSHPISTMVDKIPWDTCVIALTYKLLVFGHRNLIKKIKHTAVINILKTFIL